MSNIVELVPDFHSFDGLFSSFQKAHRLKLSGKELFNVSVYQDESTTSLFHEMVQSLSTMVKQAQPTEFHCLLARLAEEGQLLHLYTQNVDGIDVLLPPLATEVPLSTVRGWK